MSNNTNLGYAIVGINVGTSILGTFGNLLVCIAVLTTQRMTSSFHYFITSLAAADLTVSFVDQPLLVVLIHGRMHSKCLPDLDIAFRVVGNLACAVSLLTLALIALDRCLFVTQVFSYKNTMTRGKKIVLVIVWLLAIAYTSMRLTIDKKITSYLTAAIFGICYVEIIICYALTYHRVLKQRNLLSIAPLGQSGKESEKGTSAEELSLSSSFEANRAERRFARTIVMVVVVFTAAWFFIFYLRLTQPDKNYGVMYNVARTVALSSSAFNPVLYCFNNKEYRRAFRRILKKVCSCCNPKIRGEKYERLK